MSGLGHWPVRRLTVRGPSMAPTLRSGDVVLLRPARAAAAGQVVLVRWASRPGQLSVKRVHSHADGGYDVRGDHAAASTDSRELGPAEVLGVVLCRLWPRPGRLAAPGEPPLLAP